MFKKSVFWMVLALGIVACHQAYATCKCKQITLSGTCAGNGRECNGCFGPEGGCDTKVVHIAEVKACVLSVESGGGFEMYYCPCAQIYPCGMGQSVDWAFCEQATLEECTWVPSATCVPCQAGTGYIYYTSCCRCK